MSTTAEATCELHKLYAKGDRARNYKSAEEKAVLFQGEVDWLITAGYVRQHSSWDSLKLELKDVIVSRVAAIIKDKEDGTLKVRIIINILRSMVGSFVKLCERIVLPSLMYVDTDQIELANACLAAGVSSLEEIDQMVLHFADAFHTKGVHEDELPYKVFKLPGQGYGCYDTVVFGGGGASLTWGCGGALLGRWGQALFDDTEARIEIYVDDPWTGWRGTPTRLAG